MKKYLLLLALVCLLGNRVQAQTKSASNTSFTHEVYDFSNIEATTTTVWSGIQEFGSFSPTRFDIAKTQFNVSEGDIIRVSFSPGNNNTPGTNGGPEGRFKPYGGWSELIAVNNIRYGNGYYEATITGTATVNGNTVNVVDYINNNGLGIQAAYMTITSVQVISMGSLTWNGNNLVAFAGNSLPKTDRISVNNTSGYSIGVSDANNCSYLQSTTQGSLLYINNLNVGDIVRIWCAGKCRILTDNTATHDTNDPLVWNHNDPDPNFNNNNDRNVNDREGVLLQETFDYDVNNPSPTANELKIVNNHDNGTLVIRLAEQWAGIIKIEIDAVQTSPRYDYDASLEVYDMYETRSNNGAYTANESADFKLNNKNAYYLKFTNNDLSLNERIAIDNTNTWTFAHGIQASSDWSNLSICNLREGDRVLIYYTGDAPVFSSNGKDGGYTGNAAFKDTWNDGMLDANEGDYVISNGNSVDYSYCRKEGTFGNEENYPHIWLYTSYPYVMMENGHLDLALSNGNHTRIVKIKIYSDHQAMMVDDYDNETYTYTAYYNITGELQAKEHIVPGGLEVHVGNDNADQHANVVFSKEGPVSYVKAVDGYKIPGIYRDTNGQIHNNFNLANEAPTTGTYYRFIPEANGQMTVRFKATSLNYYRWDLKADDIYYNTDTGGGWLAEFDRSNEWPMDRSCPYYLMVKDGNNYSSASFKIDNSNDLSSGALYKNNEYVTLTLDVQAGKTYYLYGTWDQEKGNGDDNSIGSTNADLRQRPACGIAELLWVKFNPENKIYPLAKWVPNNTMAVNENNKIPNPDDPSVLEEELATVIGYVGATITVKKMSGNITACRPYIYREKDEQGNYKQEGKLMIDGIQFEQGKNPGGTILIKIGDPDLKTSPLYALTIAYSADPQYNGENGQSGDNGRGHTWDLTTNSLYGMKWEEGLNTEVVKDENGNTVYDENNNPKIRYIYVKSEAPDYATTFTSNAEYGGYATPTPYGTYFKDYFAEEANIANFKETEQVWNYFHNTISNGINKGSLLEEEIDYNDHHGITRSDWTFSHNLVYGDKLYDPIFSNKYDMEGDNADMIWDTEGTVIRTSANQSVIFNEFTGTDIHSSVKDPDRYVGIKEGGEFRIPWLMKNDRVIIWMGVGKGAFNDQAVFSIRNAYDALHNPIYCEYDEDNKVWKYDEYIVGGSQWTIGGSYTGDGKNDYRGCYHFFAKGDGQGGPADMVFKMTSGSMCKIYKIQIYRGDRIITNEIVGATEADNKYFLWSRAYDPNDPSDKAVEGEEGYGEKGYTDTHNYNWTLKYFGKDQQLANGDKGNTVQTSLKAQDNEIIAKTGKYSSETPALTDNYVKVSQVNTETGETEEIPTSKVESFTYKHQLGEIGTFRMRGKDMEKNMNYVADYADHNVTVAYQETKKYPYTWDFTDVTGIQSNVTDYFDPEEQLGEGTTAPTGSGLTDDIWNSLDAESYQKTARDLSLWEVKGTKGNYFLRLNSQESQTPQNLMERDNIFESAKEIGGNQVWANKTIVPEMKGLWFYTENYDPETRKSYDNYQGNGEWIIKQSYEDNPAGLEFAKGYCDWFNKIVVPNVPKNAAVYLRMRKLTTTTAKVKYMFGQQESMSELPKNTTSTSGTTNITETLYSIGNGDYIVAIMNTTGSKSNLTLSLDGFRVQKLAVSTDPKKLNIRGWATESRDHVIDPELTAYLTGKDIETCVVTEVNYAAKTITLQRVYSSANNTNRSLVMNSLEDGDTGASILHNKAVTSLTATDGEVNILNGGFHLFVPDMHDYGFDKDNNYIGQKSITDNSSMLVAQVSNSNGVRVIPGSSGNYTNYALTYKYLRSSDGNIADDVDLNDGVEAFYRIATNGASSSGNQGYLPLLTNPETPSGSGNSHAKFSIIFEEEFENINPGITTTIDDIESSGRVVTSEGFYNLNGQKMNGIPTQKGMYIVNGKKVLVK